jgi:hypothetical protein
MDIEQQNLSKLSQNTLRVAVPSGHCTLSRGCLRSGCRGEFHFLPFLPETQQFHGICGIAKGSE